MCFIQLEFVHLTANIRAVYFQANFIVPGRRPLSSCVPTVVLHKEVTKFAKVQCRLYVKLHLKDCHMEAKLLIKCTVE